MTVPEVSTTRQKSSSVRYGEVWFRLRNEICLALSLWHSFNGSARSGIGISGIAVYPPKNIQHSPTYFSIYPYKSQRSVMCLIPENSSKLSWKILIPSLRFPLYTIYPKILADPKYYYHHFHFQTFNHATGTKF